MLVLNMKVPPYGPLHLDLLRKYNTTTSEVDRGVYDFTMTTTGMCPGCWVSRVGPRCMACQPVRSMHRREVGDSDTGMRDAEWLVEGQRGQLMVSWHTNLNPADDAIHVSVPSPQSTG